MSDRERWQELDRQATPGPWLIGWNEARQADRDFCNAARDAWPAAERECVQLRAHNAKLHRLVMGLRKAVKSDETEWVDANIIRLLLDRLDSDSSGAGLDASGLLDDEGQQR